MSCIVEAPWNAAACRTLPTEPAVAAAAAAISTPRRAAVGVGVWSPVDPDGRPPAGLPVCAADLDARALADVAAGTHVTASADAAV
ncbi:MAG TPA: hypothetical protein PKA20_23485 [Burkholderiaceae bacterium]|nr:hypothetical protein [Burkholderiaceae bacterium]